MKRLERCPPKIKRLEREPPRQRGFFDEPKRAWGTPEEVERRRRIQVAVAAYAYEFKDDPIWSDAKFDREARLINLKQSTGSKEHDKWFRENFSPHTGMWVRSHPDRRGLKRIYRQIKQWRKRDEATNDN